MRTYKTNLSLLFKTSPLIKSSNEVYLIEENLFFKQYKFHKQKILFHRLTMKYYSEYLKRNEVHVNYIDSSNELSDIRNLIQEISKNLISMIYIGNHLEMKI